MASDCLIKAFAQLSTTDSRRSALQALIQELTPYEWRFVRSLTGTRTFQFDIVGRLPVELVSHIFSYLDTSTPWRLQHVSRLWYEKLRSLEVLKLSLNAWYDGAVNLQGADLCFCRRKAQSVHAFRKPSSTALPDSSFRISTETGWMPRLVGDNLLWLAVDYRQVHVLNLRSLASKVLLCDTRERIGVMSAADELVAFTAQHKGIVFIDEINGKSPLKKFRFMNAGEAVALTCRRRTVACATHQRDHTFVYIWNFDNQQGSSFRIDRNTLHIPMEFQNDLGLLLQPDTATILLCQFASTISKDGVQAEIVYWRFTYAGTCLHSTKKELEGYPRVSARFGPGGRRGIKFIPASHHGLFMLQRDLVDHIQHAQISYRLEFDEESNTFTRYHPEAHAACRHDHGNVVWWKDVFVGAGADAVILTHLGTVSDSFQRTRTACDTAMHEHGSPEDNRGFWKDILINDKWMVRPYDDCLYVICYDHTMRLPAEEGSIHGIGSWRSVSLMFGDWTP